MLNQRKTISIVREFDSRNKINGISNVLYHVFIMRFLNQAIPTIKKGKMSLTKSTKKK